MSNSNSASSLPESIVLQPGALDTYADRLMDELFSDIDLMLDGSTPSPSQGERHSPSAFEALSIQPFDRQAAILINRKPEPRVEELQQPADIPSPPVEPQPEVVNTAPPQPPVPQEDLFLDKLLVVGIVSAIGATLLLWFTNQEQFNRLFPVTPVVPEVPQDAQVTGVVEEDTEFLNYMLRSLETIDRKAAASQQPSNPNPIPESNLPSVPVPSNLGSTPNRVPTAIERVYIPVPPSPLPPIESSPSPTAAPSTP